MNDQLYTNPSDTGVPDHVFTKVGVIGAGVMGCGVAQVLAQQGIRAVLVDINDERLSQAQNTIRHNLRQDRFFNPTGPDATTVMERITLAVDYDVLADADFIVENVTEEWDAKASVYARLEKVCAPDCIYAANTSAIPITKIAATTARPDRIVGMHFMNPVPMKPMVEVIRGYHTSEATLERSRAFLKAMGKDCVIVEDSPGFVSNRVLMLTVNEAAFLVHDRVASARDVDRIFRDCFSHKMGPLETADLIGLDTILKSIERLYDAFNDSKYRPCPLLRKLVDAGLLGRKSGEGFHQYRV